MQLLPEPRHYVVDYPNIALELVLVGRGRDLCVLRMLLFS